MLFKKAFSETDTALQEGLFEGLEKVCIDKHICRSHYSASLRPA
jgi:hypothetical protein